MFMCCGNILGGRELQLEFRMGGGVMSGSCEGKQKGETSEGTTIPHVVTGKRAGWLEDWEEQVIDPLKTFPSLPTARHPRLLDPQP